MIDQTYIMIKKSICWMSVSVFVNMLFYGMVSADERTSSAAILKIADVEKVFDAIDRSYNAVSWKCRIERGISLLDEKDLQGVQKSKFFEEYTVLYDLRKKRFRVEGVYCIPWIDGESPTVTKKTGYSFDGNKYMCWESRVTDAAEDDAAVGIASISNETEQVENVGHFIATNGTNVGFGVGFPCRITLTTAEYYRAISLIELIKDWKTGKTGKLQDLRKTPDGKWIIEGIIPWVDGGERHVRFQFDPVSNGIVDKFERFARFNNSDHSEMSISVEFTKSQQGDFLPSTMREVYPLDKRMTEIRYIDVNLNPQIDDGMFQIVILDNTYVTDYITKTYYRIGDPVDEDKAIYDFMQRHGFTGDVPLPTQRMGLLQYILMGVGVVMILFALYSMLLKRRKE